MSEPFASVHHLCVVVHDLDEAVGYLSGLGIGPWADMDRSVPLTLVETANPEALAKMRYKVTALGQLQLQLCQPPLQDCPQRRHLDEHGAGVFHIGFGVEDLDRSEAVADEYGLKRLIRGRRANGTGFTYFDTEAILGLVLMVRSA